MRARSLKPGLFKNELLGSADPLLTILFAGLWCEADREGRLEDRPLRLCAEVFPHRRTITAKRVDTMLTWLHERRFIERYEVAGARYIQVLKFLKHQNPHIKERPSTIPGLSPNEPNAGTGLDTDLAPGKHEESTGGAEKRHGRAGLTPDSGLLTPSSSPPESKTPQPPTSGGPVVESKREESEQGRREDGSNPRARGANPRAIAETQDALREQERYAESCRRAREEFGVPNFRAPYPMEALEAYRTAVRMAAPRLPGTPRFPELQAAGESSAPKAGTA